MQAILHFSTTLEHFAHYKGSVVESAVPKRADWFFEMDTLKETKGKHDAQQSSKSNKDHSTLLRTTTNALASNMNYTTGWFESTAGDNRG